MNNPISKFNTIWALNGTIILIIAFNMICTGFSTAKIVAAPIEDSDQSKFYNIVFEGDSLTAEEIYPPYAAAMLDLDADKDAIHNVATPGETLSPTMILDAPRQVDAKFLSYDCRNIAVLWAGTNDIYLDPGLDASNLHESIRNWCSGRRAAGFQVIVCTITPRSEFGTPRSFEENRQALNEMIRMHYFEYADGLADIAKDPRIGDAGDELDTAYYYDRVHMTKSGYSIVASIVKDSIIGLADS